MLSTLCDFQTLPAHQQLLDEPGSVAGGAKQAVNERAAFVQLVYQNLAEILQQ